jgi:hypothetical protein
VHTIHRPRAGRLRPDRLPQLSPSVVTALSRRWTRETPDLPADLPVRRAEADRDSAGFAMPDCTFETGVSAQRRHFRDVQERWQDIEHDRWRSRRGGGYRVMTSIRLTRRSGKGTIGGAP